MATSNSVKLTFPIIFTCLIGLDLLFGAHLLHLVGWVYFLPVHNYLYVFLLLPLVVFFTVCLTKGSLKDLLAPGLSSVLVIGGLSYILAAGAQLWRIPFIPLGIIPLVMGVLLVREGIGLFKASSFQANSKIVGAFVGSILFFLLSTIYIQPWKLVINMPYISDVDMPGLDLSGTHFNLISFSDLNLDRVDFSGASLIGVDFTNVSLVGANFIGANIENCKFKSSSLKDVDFTGAWIYQTTFDDANLSNALIMPSFIGRTYITNSFLCNAKFNDLGGGVYGWTGSVINENSLPLNGGDSSCCGKLDELIITKDDLCGVRP